MFGINEKILSKANLSNEEMKVARVHFGLKTAGPRTIRWVKSLSSKKFKNLINSALYKINEL